MKKLSIQFYKRLDVVLMAKELIEKIIVTNFNDVIISGLIVKRSLNRVYKQVSHAYGGKRRTPNEHMYAAPVKFTYICAICSM